MGVYHLGGMGKNPGALTVPLTYIYILLKAANLGNEEARKFFETSGELHQERKGAPEYLIVFTSREVIQGKVYSFEDRWFNSGGDFPKSLWKYLSNLWGELEDDNFRPFYDGEWIKNIYFVEVKHTDFEDCFEKVGTTLYALREKELWLNMIGGSNQINFSLLLAGTLNAASARYYYLFQSQLSLLHPEIEKPDMRNPSSFVRIALEKWYELPVFQLTMGGLINQLSEKLSHRDMNIGELERILQEQGLEKQHIAKLRGRLITVSGERVSRGPMLERIAGLNKRIHKEIDNFTKWKEWAIEQKILWELVEGKLVELREDSVTK
jgi:hypothetical protein